MSFYACLSMVELKVECRRNGIPIYGKKRDLEMKLLEAFIKRTRDKMHKYPEATSRPSYYSKTLAELKAEAKCRKLQVSGTKNALIKRLRDADWQEWDSRLQTFPQFSKLPVEIQEYIWEYSLPGPRVLAVAHTRAGGPLGLSFAKVDHTPNPAALSTCRLARTIALKRYRLVFGTLNTYADLEGGDIFYIGPYSRAFAFSHHELWACDEPGIGRAAVVISDLEKVTHIMLSASVYEAYGHRYRNPPHRILNQEDPALKGNLSRFKSLKKVSLACGGFDEWDANRTPGQVYVSDDITKFKPMDAGDYWSYRPKVMAVSIKSHFYENPTEEEIARGIPEMQLVEVHRVPDASHRELQDAKGGPYTELYYDRPEEHWRG